MKKIFLVLNLFLSLFVFGQNEQLAMNYFDKGEFEKAIISFDDLLKNQPGNSFYFQKIVESYQQLQQYDNAEKRIQERFEKFKQPSLLVELGYNYQLRKDAAKAKKYYEQAIDKINENPSNVYTIANTFEKKVLLDYALEAYKLGIKLEPKFNFNYQMAVLYGQQGNTDQMIEMFLDEAFANPNSTIMIQNQLSRFMTEEAEESFNTSLRKALLVRAQKNQDIFWNQFLSWFFVQQKDYSKAFIQEKAIYRRDPESFSNIVNLAELAMEENEEETAREIFAFVLENTQDLDLQITAHYYLMEAKIKKAPEKDYPALKSELDLLVKKYGVSPYTLSLQLLQAHFATFNLKNPEEGKAILKRTLELPLSKYQTADVKMELADILLYEEKFNQALIYYSQIEEDLKNDAVGHEASLKAAKTSYFKTDFEWALKQFRELKSASTQLIANDALELFLLINDNTVADSTQVGLKKFARGDYLLYQNKNKEALEQFQSILKEYKGQDIEDETLLRIGQTYEKLGDFNAALSQYQIIIDNYKDGIYIDEALYFSAEIYNKQLKDIEKAKALYEQVLFNHEDSIYFVEARKKFRQLRGDANL
ncbi:Tetratricopeptide repeat protein [compost metagenome]|uniref:Tetratricopeptide repeat protein n=1 Tax=Flavobacterium endophyticum TaxID=1540163 RepID=A0A495MP11_9FLAO|nr:MULTISPECIES: tetratricopeptide repeat protein [Flavobacterium]RKS26543.1 tetratricopeptide repeat protein [Flavobacterium endophyticum]WDO13967.1 tetratricopeptide repeat protein [Flavobacterium sp. WW92]